MSRQTQLTVRFLLPEYIRWKGLKKELTGPPSRKFERWILQEHPGIAKAYQGQGALVRAQCQMVKQMVDVPRSRGIGKRTLERYLPQLSRRWLDVTSKESIGFQEFLQNVVDTYSTERALKRYLGID